MHNINLYFLRNILPRRENALHISYKQYISNSVFGFKERCFTFKSKVADKRKAEAMYMWQV